MDQVKIDKVFGAMTTAQEESEQAIRGAAKALAQLVLDRCHAGAKRSQAITLCQEVLSMSQRSLRYDEAKE